MEYLWAKLKAPMISWISDVKPHACVVVTPPRTYQSGTKFIAYPASGVVYLLLFVFDILHIIQNSLAASAREKADFLLGLSLLFCYVWRLILFYSGPEVIKLFSCSTQLSMKFQMLISIKISRNSAFLSLS